MNWKVRIKNPLFIAQLAMAVMAPILAYFGLTGQDITTWAILFETLRNAILNPYVVVTVIISVFNAITDPTTGGIKDSKRAMGYAEPWEDEE